MSLSEYGMRPRSREWKQDSILSTLKYQVFDAGSHSQVNGIWAGWRATEPGQASAAGLSHSYWIIIDLNVAPDTAGFYILNQEILIFRPSFTTQYRRSMNSWRRRLVIIGAKSAAGLFHKIVLTKRAKQIRMLGLGILHFIHGFRLALKMIMSYLLLPESILLTQK